jgi:threonine dehydratase
MADPALPLRVTGWRCATCGTELPIDTVMPWRCPNGDDRRHVLQIVSTVAPFVSIEDPNPFVSFGHLLAWRAFAEARGMSADRCDALTRELDATVASVAGTGFVWTPFARRSRLSDALGFSPDGGVWVKDETHAVGGSHKARHLFSILLHLVAAEEMGLAPWATTADRPPLAIASCGNAAIAASTLAAAADWPITVFVPPWASASVVSTLEGLGASLQVCPRLDGDPPGDPCIHRFREAVAAGAVPFSVQGPENALCLDGGRTIGWEMIEVLRRRPDVTGRGLDRVVVQVGGGAFAASVGAASATSGVRPALHAVQTEGCAPLERAWQRSGAIAGGRSAAAQHWAECMWPWEHEPHSLADGILDDETYDWIGVVSAMAASGGSPVVVAEAQIERAARIGPELTDIAVSPTGTAGLAGLLTIRDQIADDERVAIVFSGVRR